MSIDIRDKFPLGDYHDMVSIYSCEESLACGCITYKSIRHPYNCECTLTFCNIVGMDEATTLMWFLKYGELLPTHIRQLQ